MFVYSDENKNGYVWVYWITRLTAFTFCCHHQEVLHVAQAEMQLAACAAFLQILQRQLVPVQNYTQTFLQSILTGIDSKDPGKIAVLQDGSRKADHFLFAR